MNYRTILFICFILLLNSCGFHPRGSLPLASTELASISISGLARHHGFYRVLRQDLIEASVEVVDSAQAKIRINILKQKTERLILSVDTRGKTVEYEIQESLRYKITQQDKSGEIQSLSAKRILFNPGDQLLGRNREELMLRKDMYHELSRRLINRLGRQQ